MARRLKLKNEKESKETKNSYFTSKKENLEFISSGCTTLDCVLGGGYVLGRMSNIIGDKSTGKTHLATEALINFKRKYPEGHAAYRETEGAYDHNYVEEMGLPVSEIDFGNEDKPVDTIESFYEDLKRYIEKCDDEKVPGLYIIDSFDALSSEAEMKRDISEGSYGGEKQKKGGEIFRKLTKKIESSRVCLILVSQVRENIGVNFGEKYRRSGGKFLDFYASHCLWLAHTGKLNKTVKGVKRTYGISIRAQCKKNKVGFPFRECSFDFIFGYGIDDMGSSLGWLKETKKLGLIDLTDAGYKKYLNSLDDLSNKEFRREQRKVNKAVIQAWNEIETDFLPKRRKYR